MVEYSVPGGWLAHTLFVKRDVRRIFDFRKRKLAELFGEDTRTRYDEAAG